MTMARHRFYLRASKASGSDRQKVSRLIRRGWQPGRSYGEVLAHRKPERAPLREGGHHDQ